MFMDFKLNHVNMYRLSHSSDVEILCVLIVEISLCLLPGYVFVNNGLVQRVCSLFFYQLADPENRNQICICHQWANAENLIFIFNH